MFTDTHRRKLDPREETFLVDSGSDGLQIFLRYLPPQNPAGRSPVLYLHGATFPSALSVAYRFEGRSWRDALSAAGLDVWALDFLGFGGSDRFPQMDDDADAGQPLSLAACAVGQVEAAVHFILERSRCARVSLITHSWGSMPAGIFACHHPTQVDRVVMFAPLACRQGPRYMPRPTLPAWKFVTNEDQYDRFVEDVPPGESPVLSREDFAVWAEAYLDSDPGSRDRAPPAVMTPTGPLVEILRAWHGELAWAPQAIVAPVAIIRGSWDGVSSESDAQWLFDHLVRAAERRIITISRGTHLMHLEQMRTALWQESIAFLAGSITVRPTGHTSGETMMQDHHESKDIPGYNPGTDQVAKSPITLDELKDLKATCLFSDEDMVYLRLSYDVLKDQAENLVTMWRGIIAQHVHLASYSFDRETGEPDKEYGAAVGKRFAQWVLDTARAEYDQEWLDYQYEIGLRHHRAKKNVTDNANTAAHIRGRDIIGFAAATVAPMRPYLEKGGHSPDVVQRMQEAWWKSMILQVTLWSQPYMNPGDF
ncbi:Lysophospholipase, alpha-beta hydrolase superfamily [Paraburkholderia fungorum]|uniref:Lysophospholipase, alpha-beta hydrolase superfamily n=1 Tax=Paraburkholderia fungorum TaxID=134537 RepID=A0A1H1JP11_9BURK|nr:alpha/beta fold hydrolase [Paraburkholderia fungorum]SDR51405.1 Lysophospholipase, alpha-beta hydrolase superfamily [Paraburkholderia fungorum]